MHSVKRINFINGYKISLTFEDRKTKVVDIEPYLDKGIFLKLLDKAFFNKVSVKGSTIVWPNEADFCPDVLYEIGKEVKSKSKTNATKTVHSRISKRTKSTASSR